MRAIFFNLLMTLSVQALEVEHLNGVAQDSKEIMYFSSHEGVYRYDGEHNINISKYSGLPNGIVKDIEVSKNDIAYVLYSNGSIWSIDLEKMKAQHFANSEAVKIEISENSLFALSKNDLSTYDLQSKSFQNVLLNKKRIIDFDAGYGNSYVLADDGLYQVTDKSIKQLIDLDVKKGEVLATPHGAVYVANSGISFYSLLQREVKNNYDIQNASNLVFKEPYGIFYTNYDSINELSIPTLEVSRLGINSSNASYSELFTDSSNRLWAMSSNDFTLIEDQLKVTQLRLGSRYNVLFKSKNKTWLGTTDGVYQINDQTPTEITWLNNKIAERKFSVTGFSYFNGYLIVATNIGLYQVDLNTQTVNKLVDDYIINLDIDNDSLFISTSDNGLFVFDSNFRKLDYDNINKALPSKEILTTKFIGNKLYIATANGLVSVQKDEVEVVFQDEIMITDIETFDGNVYISTYGKGLLKKVSDKWLELPSPSHIKDLTLFKNKLIATTSNGLHYLDKSQQQTNLIKSTKQYSFTIGSVITNAGKLVAASDSAILEIENREVLAPKTPSISYIETESSVYFGANESIILKDWLNVALTRVAYSKSSNYRYQYSLNDSEWLELKSSMLQLTGLPGGEHQLKFREVNGEESSGFQTVSFNVATPWYKTKTALTAYVIALLLLVALGCTYLYLWVQSFHRVFRKNQTQFQKEKVSEAFLHLNAGKTLCGGDATMVTEGLVKLEKSIQLLEPVAHCNASLGSNQLLPALDFLQIQTSLQTKVKVKFDINLGDFKLDKQLERDIYSVIYHGVKNSIEHSSGKQCFVYLYRCKNNIIISVEDDGVGCGFYNKIHFGVGFYTMKQIAKAYDTKLKVSSKSGTNLEITLPIVTNATINAEPQKAERFESAL